MRSYAGHNLMRPYAGYNLMRPYAGLNLMRPCAGHKLMRLYAGHNLMLPYAGHKLMRPYAGHKLHTALNVSKEFSKNTVTACVLLHNVVRSKDVYKSEKLCVTHNWNSVNRAACSGPRRSASDVRDRL